MRHVPTLYLCAYLLAACGPGAGGAAPATVGQPGTLPLEEIQRAAKDPARHIAFVPEAPPGITTALAGTLPANNPLTRAKVELGQQLFFDPRLSRDGRVACASCHHPSRGWTDQAALSTGVDGHESRRSAPSIVNRALVEHHYWDGRAATLEEQVLSALANPDEMAFSPEETAARLAGIEGYRLQFEAVFGAPPSPVRIAKALAAFERTILSGASKLDAYERARALEPAPEATEPPAGELADKPADEPTERPADEPAGEPAAGVADEPADEPAARPADETAAEPGAGLAAEPVGEPAGEPEGKPEETTEVTTEHTTEHEPEAPAVPQESAAIPAAEAESLLSDAALRGRELFFGRARCSACHAGENLTDGLFHNLGISMERREPDLGRFLVTKVEQDKGAFRTPSLRNVALTAPYMHDGSRATLREVVAFYDRGGTKNPWLSVKIVALSLSEQERQDLVVFLEEGLTGTTTPVEVPRLP